jgi:hypothetical protein
MPLRSGSARSRGCWWNMDTSQTLQSRRRILGIDDERLTCRFGGPDFRLTDVHGQVAREILPCPLPWSGIHEARTGYRRDS